MSLYHLEVLNDKEFEELSKDILERELGVTFQIFKTGRDGGIDLRYAGTDENQFIVQAKRFVRSTYANLKTAIREERKSILKLAKKPERYFLTTTFDLSVGQVDEIVKLMHPFISNSQDVYPRERILNLITKYPDIEKKYYKLWLTSTGVLTQILNNGVSGRSEFIKDKIIKKASLYVPTVNFDTAVEKLKENHFLIVSGEPGIGKTTISYLLICDLLAKGFQLIYVDDHLKDAEDLLSPSPEVKQVVFFDDFFGANLSEIMNPRNTESKIISFIERIQSSTNKYLVMTTRTTILRQAQYRFNKFSRSGLADLSKYEMEIKSYSKLDKANILYNHMFHSGMTDDQYDVFFASDNYLKIINHPNYFPRLIEFITSANQLNSMPLAETADFIFRSLDNPAEIWHFAYDQQLNEEEQFLLMTLFSLGGYVISSSRLQKAFESRYAYEIRENGFSLHTDAFGKSLKKLLDGFIKAEKNPDSGELKFSFLNPSVADFVINFLRARHSEVKRILYSATYFSQITRYFSASDEEKIILTPSQLKQYYPVFLNILPDMLDPLPDPMIGNMYTLYMLLQYFNEQITEEQLFILVEDTDLSYTPKISFLVWKTVMSRLDEFETCQEHISENWQNFFTPAVLSCEDSSDISSLLGLFDFYHLDSSDWSEDSEFMDALKNRVNQIYSADDIDLYIQEDEIADAYFNGHHDRAMDIVAYKVSEDYDAFLGNCDLSDHFENFYASADIDMQGLLEAFAENLRNRHDDYEPTGGLSSAPTGISEDEAIRRLFER